MGRMIEHLRDGGRSSAVTDAESALESGDHLRVADIFESHTTSNEFADFLRTELDPDDLISARLHEIILTVGFRGIFTTNFDKVFERQSQPPDLVLKYPECLDNPASFMRHGFLAKIHGCISRPYSDQLVLTTHSYNSLLRNIGYSTLLKSYFISHPVLTVGFSHRDPAFKAVIASLHKAFKKNPPPLFALMHQPTEADVARLRSDYKIDVIRYTSSADLVLFFRELKELGKTQVQGPVRLSTCPLVTQRVRDVKPFAWEYYLKWRHDVERGESWSPIFGKVNVTRKGWHHICRVDIPQKEVCHRLSLLPCAREIIEKATAKRVVRDLGRRTLFGLQGMYAPRHQADVLVQVIVERWKQNDGRTRYTLLSVHEKRRAAYLGVQVGSLASV